MNNASTIHSIERDILNAMEGPLSVQQLIDITGLQRDALRVRLNAMRAEGRISVHIEDGHVTYGPPEKKAARRRNGKPAHAMRGKPGHARSGLTNDLRQVLAASDCPLGYSELRARLPQYSGDQIAAICSQRTKVGEFVAIPPTGRGRKYALAKRPPAPPEPARAASENSDHLAELRDHETYLRETAQGLLVSAERLRRVITTLEAIHA